MLLHLQDLHSTMLLLYRIKRANKRSKSAIYIPLCFYFIRDQSFRGTQHLLHLHSTMLLLYLTFNFVDRLHPFAFTFHYASTLSWVVSGASPDPLWFTFHYASTLSHKPDGISTTGLIYIPLCFYFITCRPVVQRIDVDIYIPLCFYFIACGASRFLEDF